MSESTRRSVANRKEAKRKRRKSGEDHQRSNQKKRSFFNIKWIILVLLATIFLIMGGCSAVILAGNYVVDEDELVMPQTSVFLDQEGKEFGEASEEDREYVNLNEMPEYLYEAFVAIEDHRFRDHYGVDPQGVLRALWVDLKTWSLAEGSSTITMQLARNVFLTNEKRLTRKIKEALIAVNLELNYSKDEILEMYLNQIYFGHGKYGVETATEWFFGKTVRKDGDKETISLSEAALLAGVPKGPEYYSPKKNLEASIERRDLVLNRMEEVGFISAEEKETAMNQEIQLASHEGKGNKYEAYLNLVREEAKDRFGLTGDELNRGGFKIYTQLNRQAQEAVESTYQNDDLFPKGEGDRIVQSGMTIMDPTTGGIVAVAGGRDYEAGNFNRSLAKVQAGSAMKPVVTYAPALEHKGMAPYDTVKDEPIMKKDGKNWPRNVTGTYHGNVYMIDAVKHSYNAAAVWLLDQIGVKTGYAFATQLGLDIPEKYNDDDFYSLTLGAPEVSTVAMAQAYSPFANKGVMVEAHAIEKIEYPDGTEVEADEPQVEQVMRPEAAYYMTYMLQAVVEDGTGTRARISGREVAGKTGTTDHSTRIWFVGYTPQYVAAIYMGRDEANDEDVGESSTGPRGPANLFSEVMAKALEGLPSETFAKPDDVAEPVEPLNLIKIDDLRAQYDAEANQASLNWHDFDSRASYLIYRSIGEEEATQIGETNEGQFVDEDIEIPKRGGGLFGLFGGQTTEITYHYYVVPVNKETGEEGARSNTATIVISPPENEEEDPESEQTDEAPPDEGDSDEGPPSPGEHENGETGQPDPDASDSDDESPDQEGEEPDRDNEGEDNGGNHSDQGKPDEEAGGNKGLDLDLPLTG